MKSEVILSSTSVPLFLLLFFGGLYLTLRTGFVQLRYPFLSLKILTGALDWKGSRGKLTPGRAFFAGTMGALIPGTVAGAVFALFVSGPSIFPIIWLIHLFQSAAEFILSTATMRSRGRGKKGVMESSLLRASDRLTRIRWSGILYAIFFSATSLLAASVINVYLLQSMTAPLRSSVPLPGPMGLSVTFLFAVIMLAAGGIRRVGSVAKFTARVSLLLLLAGIAALLFNPAAQTGDFLRAILEDIAGPFHAERLPVTALSVAVYFALAEYGNGRLALISGLVRTDNPAKQGLVAMLFPFFQMGVSFIAGALAFGRFGSETVSADRPVAEILRSSIDVFDRFFSSLPGLQVPQSPASLPFAYLVTAILLLLLVLSTITLLYAGNMTFRHLTANGIPNAFPAAGILLALATGYFAETGSGVSFHLFVAYLVLAFFTAFFALLLALLFARSARQELARYQNSREGRRDLSRDVYLMLLTLLPENLLSRFFGWFSLIHFPGRLQSLILRLFARAYDINLEEARLPIEAYPNLNAFFTRELKPGVRPITSGRKTIVSPVDARLSRMGRIQEGLLIQAKGIYYTLKDLIGDPEIAPRFQDGSYCVLYLSPQDYHRIHTPFECEVAGYTYSPGRLFPVNELAVEGVYGLFPKNERLTSILRTRYGHIAMIKVGATNVGKIRVTYDSIRTNKWFRRHKAHLYFDPPRLERGVEIGRFEMGSTVILLFEKDTMTFLKERFEGEKVKLGQAIARFL